MEENQDTVVSKELKTMLPIDVHHALTEYAKAVSKTGLGKWDYGVAIRSLLEQTQNLGSINFLATKVLELEERIDSLENNPIERKETVKFLGGGEENVK